MSRGSSADAWKRMVLESMPLPAWLGGDAPQADVVLSCRARYARNLRGLPFPHCASAEQLAAARERVGHAAAAARLGLSPMRVASDAERDYLLGSRLISREFAHRDPRREVWLDDDRTLVLMVNEEDHLRLQALTAGWSPGTAARLAGHALERIAARLDFARDANMGHLTASPQNAGAGRRISALFHLIGLAHVGRLSSVMGALADRRMVVRGMFGEASRATGAFFQISSTGLGDAAFVGAGEYLAEQERAARQEVSSEDLGCRARTAAEFAIRSSEISLTDALRVLAWIRWAAAAGVGGFEFPFRMVDRWVATMEVRSASDPARAARDRAAYLRGHLEGAWWSGLG